jgi:DNA (cytosine-5)-methyltransferase 1
VLSNRANNVPRLAETEPTHPVLTGEHLGVVHLRQHQSVRSVREPVGTVSAGGGHHGVVVAHYDPGWARRAEEEPFGTVTARDHHSLVMVVPYDSSGRARDAEAETSPTLSTRDRVAVVWSDDEIDDCRFRMFALHEIAQTMSMRDHVDGNEYVVLGNKRERMAQYGNAVTPPVMQLLVERLLEVV